MKRAKKVEARAKAHQRKAAASITKRLNQVYRKTSTELDPVIARMQFLSLPPEKW